MPGAMTIGGMSYGLGSGSKVIGPVTITAKEIIGQITDVSLAALADTKVTVPTGATAVMVAFPVGSETPEVKVRTNLNSADAGLPVPAVGFAAFPLNAGVTELILHPAASLTVELSFI